MCPERERVKTVTHQLDIDQLVGLIWHDVLCLPDVRHIAPIVCAIFLVRRDRRVVDEAIHARRAATDHMGEVVDERLRRRVPAQVDSRRDRGRHAAAAATAADDGVATATATAGAGEHGGGVVVVGPEGSDVQAGDEEDEQDATETDKHHQLLVGGAGEARHEPKGIHPFLCERCRSHVGRWCMRRSRMNH